MLCIILDEKFPAVNPRPKTEKSKFKLLYRKIQKQDEDSCKCKNKDKCRCKKEWGMGDKKQKAKRKDSDKEVLPDINLRRPFDQPLYPFEQLDPWIEQTGKPLTFKEIQQKPYKRYFNTNFSSNKNKNSPKQRQLKPRKIRKNFRKR